MKTKELTEGALLLSLAFVLSYLEAQIPFGIAVPGVKLGLANIVTMFVLYRYSAGRAYGFMVFRVILTGIVFSGIHMMLFSFAGGSLCILAMWLAGKTKLFSVMGISMIGAVFHNVGQILVTCVLMENTNIFYYLPVLCLSGLISGFFIGYVSGLFIQKLNQSI